MKIMLACKDIYGKLSFTIELNWIFLNFIYSTQTKNSSIAYKYASQKHCLYRDSWQYKASF